MATSSVEDIVTNILWASPCAENTTILVSAQGDERGVARIVETLRSRVLAYCRIHIAWCIMEVSDDRIVISNPSTGVSKCIYVFCACIGPTVPEGQRVTHLLYDKMTATDGVIEFSNKFTPR